MAVVAVVAPVEIMEATAVGPDHRPAATRCTTYMSSEGRDVRCWAQMDCRRSLALCERRLPKMLLDHRFDMPSEIVAHLSRQLRMRLEIAGDDGRGVGGAICVVLLE
ncbi:MAG: hypothetical protein CBC12_07110 [Candidatus Puniceispirillum sp. TMED52]|nr:MAG: hypothetical protein CBC12_07110 [Candidatus Puniceispirillum sp. TMED52]|tara:strand:- start:34865 stop:35185 length:321 start_codon:yes stop_codon:yes gene_type:complete